MEQGQKSKGKRKISMEAIQNKAKRQVTFSKRRCGLFKKASELSIISGAEVAVITFSNAGKPFTFSHPVSPDELIWRFVNHTIDSNPVVFAENNDGGPIKIGSFSTDHHHQQQQHYYNNNVVTKFDGVKKEVRTNNNIMMLANESMPSGSSNDGFWWDNNKSVDDLGLAELELFKESLEGSRNQVISKLENKQTRVHQSVQDFDMVSIVHDGENCIGLTQTQASHAVEKSFDNVPLLQDHHGFTGESSKLDNEINVGQSSMDSSVVDQDFDIGCFMDDNGVAADQLSFDDELSFAWKNEYDSEDHGLSGDALLDMLLNGY